MHLIITRTPTTYKHHHTRRDHTLEFAEKRPGWNGNAINPAYTQTYAR